MRLSLQTVCIIFGVTLAHLFIISALSPVQPELPGTKLALDPELESLLEADAGNLAGDLVTEPVSEEIGHPPGGSEVDATTVPSVHEEAAATRPAPDLAGNEETPVPASPSDEPVALHPTPAIREIRTIAPAPRS